MAQKFLTSLAEQLEKQSLRYETQRGMGLGVWLAESDQIRSVALSCPTLCDPMNHSTPGLPVHHQLPEFTQTHVHRVSTLSFLSPKFF